MRELKYRLYCLIHYAAKRILGRDNVSAGNMLSLAGLRKGVLPDLAQTFWNSFVESSYVPKESSFGGHLYAGFIAEKKEWCLESWIWTNAAVVRMYCITGQIDKAKLIAECLLKRQQSCGGWIVRNDYDKNGAIPMLAPNDSAYIANNTFISLYEVTGEKNYLDVAIRCADWIIETARLDGMVYVGYNLRDQCWDKNCVIVDVGFTAGLFAKLVHITKNEKYLSFLKTFTERYIELFYIREKKGFTTSIDKADKQQGGMFGRGQAWALEGLIPAYKVLKLDKIKNVIEHTIENLMQKQCSDGAWSYNLTKPFMGEDCKSTSVIAKSMMDWYNITGDIRILRSVEKAIQWCYRNTATDGEAKGGIFSFCMEGAIVHDLYTSTAFVYASSYAIELQLLLNKWK